MKMIESVGSMVDLVEGDVGEDLEADERQRVRVRAVRRNLFPR